MLTFYISLMINCEELTSIKHQLNYILFVEMYFDRLKTYLVQSKNLLNGVFCLLSFCLHF